MSEININGVNINFPFEPYNVQKAYMTKIIECLDSGSTNAVLESPTGTGKTLSLLCSILAWVSAKKKQMQIQARNNAIKAELNNTEKDTKNDLDTIDEMINTAGNNWGVPKVIYATRTHSQLSQAMQELKRSNYSFLKSVVLGSRDQLCIHPEVSKEKNNATKIQLCKLHITNRSCSFHSRIESKKENPEFKNKAILDIEDLITIGTKLRIIFSIYFKILDIEDLITIGTKLRMCPYYASREVMQEADILFMPYNYLLDPTARKANKIELSNTIVILDEAHNVEKICEESASVQIKSSDIALAIEDCTYVMKVFTQDQQDLDIASSEEAKDFTVDDLVILKELLLKLEEAVDAIDIKNNNDGEAFPGAYIFDLLAQANINFDNYSSILAMLEKILTFLTTMAQKNPIIKKGLGLQVFQSFLMIAFTGQTEARKEKIRRSFKLHVQLEELKGKQSHLTKQKDGWMSTKPVISTKSPKIINYWCFNPGFGMEALLDQRVRNIILTSGTLAPLKPLIAELGIPVKTHLENPHIVGKSQVFVKVISHGPDKEKLISNYENRDNPKYVNSLGSTILNFCNVVPDGILIFFPSYILMNKCGDTWRASGLWTQINRKKPIFVEPQGRDAFATTMSEFYEKIRSNEGACFMAVCRGKVSEGLDFADMNGRGVIITGLPFPPFKDPRVVLKRQYLQENRTRENQLLSGQDWYSLEASRAVNQAIGRVIRHKNDYGAILLCDIRFGQRQQQQQLSSWIQGHLRNQSSSIPPNFGVIQKELRSFFENARKTLPKPCTRELKNTDLKNLPEINIKKEINDDIPTDIKKGIKEDFKKEIVFKFNTDVEPSNRNFDIEHYNYVEKKIKQEISPKVKNYLERKPTSGDSFMSRLDENVSTINFNDSDELVTIHKRERSPLSKSPLFKNQSEMRKKRFKLVSNTILPNCSTNTEPRESTSSCSSSSTSLNHTETEMSRQEFLSLVKNSLSKDRYGLFISGLIEYKNNNSLTKFFEVLRNIFEHPSLIYLLKGMKKYIKEPHKDDFDKLLANYQF